MRHLSKSLFILLVCLSFGGEVCWVEGERERERERERDLVAIGLVRKRTRRWSQSERK